MIDATPLLRLAAARRGTVLARMDPVHTQEATLRSLLWRAAKTRFGLDHGFGQIKTVEAYQAAVKLRDYEAFWRDYEAFWRDYWESSFPILRDTTWPGRIRYFAQSSGTTGGPAKHIPVSRAMNRSNAGAVFDTLVFHLGAKPRSQVMGGLNFLLGGSVGLERLAPGVRADDLSGISATQMPVWTRPRAFPPRRLALISDWEAKTAALASASVGRDIRGLDAAAW